ncbi:hypothetical protein B0S90_2843 [Caldicellulosiruptor bescii]|uniref:Uncharacterized protein n=2 Tax=Caldicellulosiruptor bescii TaxID=31899 RepID=B9MP08_CALBD|nr:hypothetical protein [Caldicellulosiruptor bescii]ACM61567.1 hypothetical protein Athe_2499 [Caldicellulosiruptor bescii DSM 6725]PBC88620.1 hypothetical protein B0S87_1648 [Caldicellulosiruptor bescii]PBC91899.1 hypothetical protein B0S89_2345 [Caldicellulosiruptor bescii]PBD02690.1 hypothetical protein B0S85_0229 [Caldicellulosiruptor bescii]PBD07693.1 hypothetical protein B0S90_2843 [Caldicellulosiruptor bescii]
MARKSKIQIAREAVCNYLREHSNTRYIMLFDLSVIADNAAGKELFKSLYDYEQIVPGRTCWIPAEKLDQTTLCRGLGGNFLVVENPYYRNVARA